LSESAHSLDPRELGAYFALMEVSTILRHAVEQHLRAEGELSYVQFQILARLNGTQAGTERMTDLADGVVYSRSGLTYQAGLLQARGLISRSPSPHDERSTIVTITDAGRALIARVMPGHIEVVSRLFLEPLSRDDLEALTRLLTPVRDHMRTTPPRSAAPRHRKSTTSDAKTG
jgi:DNA-binding MarR family transcriptional regulator